MSQFMGTRSSAVPSRSDRCAASSAASMVGSALSRTQNSSQPDRRASRQRSERPQYPVPSGACPAHFWPEGQGGSAASARLCGWIRRVYLPLHPRAQISQCRKAVAVALSISVSGRKHHRQSPFRELDRTFIDRQGQAMLTKATLRPGLNGTKGLTEKYGKCTGSSSQRLAIRVDY